VLNNLAILWIGDFDSWAERHGRGDWLGQHL